MVIFICRISTAWVENEKIPAWPACLLIGQFEDKKRRGRQRDYSSLGTWYSCVTLTLTLTLIATAFTLLFFSLSSLNLYLSDSVSYISDQIRHLPSLPPSFYHLVTLLHSHPHLSQPNLTSPQPRYEILYSPRLSFSRITDPPLEAPPQSSQFSSLIQKQDTKAHHTIHQPSLSRMPTKAPVPATPTPTPYQLRVYALLSQIPRGRLTTYASLARALNSSPRAGM